MFENRDGKRPQAYPDTLVGTDSHTTMINGLGVLGWGVGGIEAEAAMLGQPVSMLIPEVIGFKLTGRLPEGATATDLVLTVTERLRAHGVVGAYVEALGDGLATVSLADRATIANMSPEFGATTTLFPIDEITLDYLTTTGRSDESIALVETYAKAQGLWRTAGAEPLYLDTRAEDGFLPDLDAVPPATWDRCQLLYLCSPGNPAGAVMDLAFLRRVIALAERHDFIIAADECYAELYPDEAAPPPSLLNAALAAGHTGFERCIVFHSLSKRSSLPGLRSGFVAGDRRLLEKFLLYRTYHGSAMPEPTQRASIAAWNDDAHVRENRALYREKFARVLPILAECFDVSLPQGGFYLWPQVGRDDAEFTRELFAATNVTVVPGSYLSRGAAGAGRVRISLVASVDECVEAAHRIASFVKGRTP